MRILLIGATGTLGTALHKAYAGRGHEVVPVSRSTGYDITDPGRVTAMYAEVGPVQAVVSAAGHVPYKLIGDMTTEDYLEGFRGKVLSQIELVRQGPAYVNSYTLITGVLAREPIPTGSAASMANGAVEAFVRAAAIEIAPRRINAVSPTVFTESLGEYGDFFPGMESVDLARVAQAFIRSVEGAQTGQIYAL